MRIDFNAIAEKTFSNLHGGSGDMTSKTYADEQREVIPCRIHPGGSIGLHRHDDGDDINYVLYGTGRALCDGKEEILSTDVCHICPKGSEHSIENTGFTDLVMLTIVVKR